MNVFHSLRSATLSLAFLSLCLIAPSFSEAAPSTRPAKRRVVRPSNTLATPSLASYLWKKRILLIFANAASSPALRLHWKKRSRLQREIKDRDLQMYLLFKSGKGFFGKQRLARSWVLRMQARWNRPSRERLVLLGKDGTLKKNRLLPVDWKQIFRWIDAMPMRQEEILQKQRSR